jgi:hypothetical protein
MVEASHPSARAEYIANEMGITKMSREMMVAGKDYSARSASPFGSLPAATLSRCARIEPGRSFSSFPARAEYGANEMDIMNKSQESDGGGEGLLSA